MKRATGELVAFFICFIEALKCSTITPEGYMIGNILFFVLGMLSLKLFQELFSVVKAFYIFKYAELYSISLLCELEVMRNYCLQIVKLCFDEADKASEYGAVEAKINEKFVLAQNNTLQLIKNKLPYNAKYSTLQEAHKELLNQTREK